MGTNRRCKIRPLASSKLCTVEYCPGCGLFHVSLGMFTIRFKLAALHLVSSTLAAGLETYKHQQTSQPATLVPSIEREEQLH